MVAQRQRGPYYDFEYELDSTRGRKRVFSTGACGQRSVRMGAQACAVPRAGASRALKPPVIPPAYSASPAP